MPAVFTLHTCRDSLGLCLVWQTRPMLPGPQVMRFVFLRLEFCSGTTLQIPPRGGHPCLRLAVGAITLRSGLKPPSRCPCRAHHHNPAPCAQGAGCRVRGTLHLSLSTPYLLVLLSTLHALLSTFDVMLLIFNLPPLRDARERCARRPGRPHGSRTRALREANLR